MKIQKNSYFKMKNLKGYFVLPVVFIGVSLLSSSANAITFDNVDDEGTLSFDGNELNGVVQYDTIIGTDLNLEDVFLSFNATATGEQNAYGAYLFQEGATITMNGTISDGTNNYTGTIFTGTLNSNLTTLNESLWDLSAYGGGILDKLRFASNGTVEVVSDPVLNAFLDSGSYSLTTTALTSYSSGDTITEADLVLTAVNVPSTGHTLTMLGFGIMSLNVIVRRRSK